MRMTEIIYGIVYLVGYVLSFCMFRIEQEADKETYTKGDRAACIFFSFFSLLAILYLLVSSWIGKIRGTGYWNQPVKPTEELE